VVTPVVQVRLADAGDLFMAWRWTVGVQGFGTGQAPADEVAEAVAALNAALPGDMRTAFETGALGDYSRELKLSQTLAEAMWPAELTDQIRQVGAAAGRPLVRIQPSPRVAQVPWELLSVGPEERLLDLADVVTTVPVSLQRKASSTRGSDTVVLVLDPRVPGARPGSPLGSVLGQADPALIEMVQRHLDAGDAMPSVSDASEALRRNDLDRDWLSTTLRGGARRLMYVGHVSSAPVEAGQSEDAQLHLCCGPETTGFADVVRSHRPLSAKDLLLGTLTLHADGVPGSDTWPAPPRVALIACESGGDLRFGESFGLASAMIHNGAELVTATRWPVPTSHAFHRLASVAETTRPLSDLVVAVDSAHDQPDPVQRLGQWQLAQLNRWRADGRIEHSPLLWGAVTTLVT
jgi:hypothetical protein